VPRFRFLLLIPLVLAAVLLPGSGRAADPIVLKGTVGPGFNITLRNASNQLVTRVLPGEYTIQVQDNSIEHNFHLSGPGVDMRTDVETTGPVTWSVRLVDGKYSFKCDAHPVMMKGTLNVGVAPPPTPKLTGRVGPGKTISLRTSAGAAVKSVRAGTYKVAVVDLTKKDNFHLFGRGVNKKTGVKTRTKPTWTVTFRAGATYTVRSDASPKRLRRTFKAVSKVGPPPPPAPLP
jgi:hypothetical protein